MNLKNIRDNIMGIVGIDWIARNQIEHDVIDQLILDELQHVVGEDRTLEGSWTATGDGTNDNIILDDYMLAIRGVWYGYTANDTWGTKLNELTSIEEVVDITDTSVTSYFFQSMHRENKQRIYFNSVPEATETIRILGIKWLDEPADELTTLETRRLWNKAVRHSVVSTVCRMGKTASQNNIKASLAASEAAQLEQTMKTVRSIDKRPLVGTTAKYRDMG